jgi:hypothetical protein
LELDLAGVLVSEGNFYQGLIGGDLLSGKQDILGAATITMPCAGDTGHITWKQNKLGCIAIAPLLHQTSSNAVTLPPPPARVPTDTPTSTFDDEGVNLDAETKKTLS